METIRKKQSSDRHLHLWKHPGIVVGAAMSKVLVRGLTQIGSRQSTDYTQLQVHGTRIRRKGNTRTMPRLSIGLLLGALFGRLRRMPPESLRLSPLRIAQDGETDSEPASSPADLLVPCQRGGSAGAAAAPASRAFNNAEPSTAGDCAPDTPKLRLKMKNGTPPIP